MAQPDVDGCLVGGASLVVDEFSAIARSTTCPRSDLVADFAKRLS
jgi:triosephosphate isomerase